MSAAQHPQQLRVATPGMVFKMLAGIGSSAREHWDDLRHAAAVIGTALYTGIWPRYWSRTARLAFSRQVMAIGIEPLLFVGALAVFVGISIVVQLSSWIGEAGQSQLLGPVLVIIVARELGVLKIDGKVRALEKQGGDAFLQLVVPRVLGATVSTFCLTIVFIFVAFVSGY